MGSPFIDDAGRVRNGWKILGFVALMNLLGFLAWLLGQAIPSAWKGVLSPRWIDAVVALAATWVCLRVEDEPLRAIGLERGRAFLKDFVAGVLLGAAIIGIAACAVRLLGGFHWVRTPRVGPAALLSGIWLYLAVAWAEELLFRGYPFQRAARGLGFPAAQAAFALAFAAAHWNNPGMSGATRIWATLTIALAALLLGLAWRRTGSLALPIGLHLGWNWMQGPLLGFGVSGTSDGAGWWTPVFHGRPQWLTGGEFGLEASAACALACAAAILGLWRWKGRGGATGI
ncbi:type II CAAX prenyl endopeptidase Rce1 family protein [Geothrix sp. 21YS21S-4]|uniref:CPBP family glutamic-type intramembrane protease n=1 Tax=Geothrix sp. 21YS21S-4 TaxID=3068889 RepID=UPI0027B8C357|nr:CPBP family glutamic-type intramembrane protease [Geothrix sp. 21YS21S-4]